ncbi:MAG: cadherin domain-containing protein [Candidatus Marinarcus sp.]|uniref:cadherin domain-containing protein n=1 Tax=Candidatus Marinarcus sp. TaxID=3100987 RepID=UPI003B00CCF1
MINIVVKSADGSFEVLSVNDAMQFVPKEGDQFYIDNLSGGNYTFNLTDSDKSIELIVNDGSQRISLVFKDMVDLVQKGTDGHSAKTVLGVLDDPEGFYEFQQTVLNSDFKGDDVIASLKELLAQSDASTDKPNGVIIDNFTSLANALSAAAAGGAEGDGSSFTGQFDFSSNALDPAAGRGRADGDTTTTPIGATPGLFSASTGTTPTPSGTTTDGTTPGGGDTDHAVGAVTDTDTDANTVSENAAIGTVVEVTGHAVDPDGDTVTYSLTNDAGGLFTIDAETGVVTVAGNLDYETATSHDIEITATSTDGSTSKATFTIGVTNADGTATGEGDTDHAVGEVTDTDTDANTVSENAAIGTVVEVTGHAVDPDGDTVTYSLTNDAGGLFTIDAETGVVTVAGNLDYETATSHDIEITATSTDGSTSKATFTIGVTNADGTATGEGDTDHAVGAVTDTDTDANTVSENAAIGTVVEVTGHAVDPDGDTVTYSLTNDAGGLFTIDAETGVVTVAGNLDYETATSHDIEITATSTDGSTSKATFTIGVTNADGTATGEGDTDHAVGAVTDTDTDANTVSENAAIGTVVEVTGHAVDPDGDTVTYSLTNDAGGLFTIDAETGVVTVAGNLDYETATSHDIEITATSTDGSTSKATFTIGVTNVNDAATIEIDDSSVVTFTEDTASEGSKVADFTTTDEDGDTVTVTVSNAGDTQYYAISGNTVVLTQAGADLVNSGADLPTFTVSATDGKQTTPATDSATPEATTDVNDAATIEIDDSSVVTFTEDTASEGSKVADFTTTDEDGDTVTVTVSNAGDTQYYAISGNTVVLTQAGADLVNSGADLPTFTVSATDGKQTTPATDSATPEATTDVNDAATIEIDDSSVVTFTEDTASEGSKVADFTTTDEDGDTVTVTVSNAGDTQYYAISGNTVVLTQAGADLVNSGADLPTFTVSATDGKQTTPATDSATPEATTDVNDAATIEIDDSSVVTFTEDTASEGSKVADFTTTDEDGDTVTVTVSNAGDTQYYAISGNTVVLTQAGADLVNSGADLPTFTVSATDGKQTTPATDSATPEATTDVNDAATIEIDDSSVVTFTEDTASEGSKVADFTTTDEDGDTVTVTVSNAGDTQYYAISGNTVVLTQAGADLVNSGADLPTFTVSATDGKQTTPATDSATPEATTDVNDAATIEIDDSSVVTFTEDTASEGSKVADFTTTDEDGDTVTVTVSNAGDTQYYAISGNTVVLTQAGADLVNSGADLPTFTVSATDGKQTTPATDSATPEATTDVNDAATIEIDDSSVVTFTEDTASEGSKVADFTTTDEDGDTVTVTVSNAGDTQYYAISGNTVVLTQAGADLVNSGADLPTFTVSATDGKQTTPATDSATPEATTDVNDAATIEIDDSSVVTFTEDTASEGSKVADFTTTDEDGDTVTVTVSNAGDTQYYAISGNTVVLTQAGADLVNSGADLPTFTVSATDGKQTTPATDSATPEATTDVNDAATIEIDDSSVVTFTEDTASEGSKVADFTTTDEDGDTVTVTVSNAGDTQYYAISGNTVVLTQAGADLVNSGADLPTFTVSATDGKQTTPATDSATPEATTDVNDAATIEIDDSSVVTFTEDTASEGSKVADFTTTDEDGDTVTVTVSNAGDTQYYAISGNTVVLTQAGADLVNSGADLPTFTVSATDGKQTTPATDSATPEATTDVNDAATIEIDDSSVVTFTEDTASEGSKVADFTTTDEDGDTVTVTVSNAGDTQYYAISGNTVVLTQAGADLVNSGADLPTFTVSATDGKQTTPATDSATPEATTDVNDAATIEIDDSSVVTFTEDTASEGSKVADFTTTDEDGDTVTVTVSNAGDTQYYAISGNTVVLTQAGADLVNSGADLPTFTVSATDGKQTTPATDSATPEATTDVNDAATIEIDDSSVVTFTEDTASEGSKVADFTTTDEDGDTVTVTVSNAGDTQYYAISGNTVVLTQAGADLVNSGADLPTFTVSATDGKQTTPATDSATPEATTDVNDAATIEIDDSSVVTFTEDTASEGSKVADFTTTDEDGDTVTVTVSNAGDTQYYAISGNTVVLTQAGADLVNSGADLPTFTVSATDGKQTTPATDSATPEATTDVNDAATIEIDDSSVVTFTEDTASEGSKVADFTTTDEDGDTVTVTVSNAGDTQYYAISGNTVVLTQAGADLVNSGADLPTFTVSATDGKQTTPATDSATPEATTDVNDAATIEIDDSSVVTFTEDTASEGSKVADFTTTDEDGDTVTVTVSNAGDTQYYAISGNTVVLTQAGADLVNSGADLPTFTVSATDGKQTTPATDSATPEATTDVNDAATIEIDDSSVVTFTEDTASEGSKVADFTTTDEDGDTVTVTVSNAGDTQYYAISGNTVVLTQAGADLVNSGADLPTFTVSATDGKQTTPATDSATPEATTDVNDAATIEIDDSSVVTFTEDTASEGSKVADFTTTDEDGDTVTVTVSNAGDTQYYAISGNTVVLTQAGADLVNSGADLPTFTVSATDGKQTTPATDSATPEATTDVNDAATIEIDDSSVVTFTEDTASEGSKVADFTTTDEDGDTVTVTVSNAGDTQYYAISGNTVVLTQAGADLVNSGADLPTFTVSATDGKQTTPATDSATPEATTDVNDAATIEIDDSSVVTFTEDTASEGSKVADFTTTDEDGDTVTVTVSNAGDTQYYAISGNTVVLTQAGADLVNSGADLPTFTVSATDGKQTTPATDSATPEATTDVNDAATIEIDDSSVVTFTEDTASEGSKVADFTTTDEDGDTVTVTVSNAGDTQYYAISGNTVVLTQAGADLVNSGADLPTFTVSATDGKQTTPATDSATPEATTDVNDAATIEIDDSSVVTFTEDTASEGSKVADFTTTDEDGDTVTVTVSNAGDTQYYAISGNTVVLTQAGADLVNSGADLPTFTVSATDGKQTTPATDSATPEATTDVNDAATIEIDDSSVVTFTEDTASEGSKVADFTTTDEDGDTVTVTVSNAGDTQYYAISGNTVVLTQAGADLVNSGADLPTFTVSATDGKQTTPATDSATPEATTDVNDAATIEIDDSSVVTFTEDTASEGSKVADFTTTDEDGDTVTVTVSNAGDTQYYAISGNTVVLTQAGADLVNSGADLPTFTVSATDGKQTTPATDSATPEATTDVNDAATIEIDDSSVVTFTEDTASEGSKVADFTTTDEDGDTVTVTVSNAGDTQYYAISGNTVVLTQAGADLVNSGADLPTFTVSATDGKQTTPATDSATPEATTDVNDAATIEIDDSSVVTFTEDTASEGSKVADFTTTDEDGDTVTVTVSNAGDTQYYAISGNTVVLTQAGADLVNSGADLPTFTVSATDGKQTTPATDSATPEATTDVNDAATIEIDDSSVVTFTEDTASEGSKVADFTTTDEDGDTVTVTVSNAGDTQYYAISGNTVVLTQAGADLVNSGADLPTFTVSATDGKQTTPATDSATPEATTDVNDAATIEIDDSSVVTFTEDTASEGSKVADFTTTDEDGDTVTVTVSNAGDTQYYAISGNTVVLTQAGADLVNSGADLPTFTVSATDGKQTTPATDSATPEATTDVNDAATIEIDDSSVVTFTEDTASEGSKVADFTTTDEDGDTVTVTVSNAGDTQYYAISGNTVVLTQAGADLVNSGADLPTFTVSATDGKQTTPATDSATPEATTDVNDAATIEIDDSSVVTFTEDTASEGSKVADFTTTDEDGDTVTVTVSNAGDTQYYAISGNTVVLTQAGADLVNSGADLPTFTVSATDGKQTTPATDSATPEATTDVNDAATIEIDDSSVVTFTEDTASEGSKVADFTTTDEDGDTVTVTVSNAGDTQYYAISGNTVVLTQAGADLVNSGADLPTFTVSATDGKQTTPATDSATPEATTDVNDAATIEIDDSSVVTFTEDTASEGSKVADFTTTDEDGDTVTVTVSNAGDTQYYAISGNTVVLTQAGADLVNSGADLPTFTVSATDGKQTTPATDSATPEATTDVNDAATIEIDDSSVVTFTEDTASEGSKVADFTTTDEDGDTVTVTVSNAGDTQYYAISGNTVVLTQAGADLVNSGADLPTFTVSATDGKQTTPATDSATPEATTDVNDAATIEIDDSSVVTFTEDTASEGSKVADFTTTDEDGDTVTVTVSNAGDTQYYAISGNTVVLTQAGADLVNSGADLPTFTVSATDGKQTTPATDSATPEATTDVNDAATIEIDDSSVVTFTEDTASEGSKVADFTTTDEDGDTVTVTVSNAGDTQYYAISGNTVVLTQAGADLVNSGADLPTFTVSATDGKQTTPATDSATPEATTDVNDAATIEIDDSSVVTFTEDTASEGSKVADFTTTDEDGDTVTVTVSNAGDTQYYAISGNTVVLTQAGADLVNSGADLPTFTVSATDGKQTTPATDSATPEATTDVNDAATIEIDDSSVVTFTEDTASEGSKVADFTTTDEDGDTVTVTVSNAGDTQYYAISGNTVVLTQAGADLVNSGADLPTFTVSATDGKQTTPATDSATPEATTDVNDAATIEIDDSSVVTFTEDTASEGSKVADFTTTDEDGDTVTVTVSNAGDTQYYAISGNTVVLTQAGADLVNSGADLPTFTVSATDGKQTTPATDSATPEATTDVNDAATIEIDDSSVVTFTEDTASEGSKVADFTTTDEDGDTVTVTVSNAGDTQYYAISGNTVVLTQAGADLVNSGADLPTFTVSATDGKQTTPATDSATPEATTDVNDAATIEIDDSSVVTFTEDTASEGSKVADFTTTDEDGDTVTVTVSNAGDTQYYAISGNTVVLTQAGADLVNSGADLPTFTVSATDGKQTTPATDSATPEATTDVNDAATIEIDDSSVVTFTEDTASEGSKVADFTTTDEDGDTVTVTVSNAGDTQYYAISGNTVVLTQAGADLVNSGADLPTFTVSATDGKQTTPATDSATPEATTDVNDAATIEIDDSSVVTFTEDTASEGSKVADFTTTDEDGDTVTVTVSNAGDTQYYAISGNTVVLTQAGADLVNSGADLPTFTVSATDGKQTTPATDSATPEATTDVNDAATIEIDDSSVVTFTEDTASEGSKVADFTTTDEDGDTVTVTVSNAGDTQYYAISGNTVVLTQAGADLVNSGADLPTFTVSATDGKQTTPATDSATPEATTDVNDAATIEIDDSSVVTFTEDTASEGSKVADFTTTDEDGDTVTVTVSNAGDTQYYAISGNTVVLTQAGADLVNSGADLPTFTVSATDGKQTTPATDSATPEATTDVNDAATIEIDDSSVVTFTEDTASEGSKVADFTTTDEDGDTVTVTVSNAGDTQYYAISGNTVVLTQAGADLVNSGADLPTFTVSATDGKQTTPATDSATPEATTDVNDAATIEIDDSSVVTFTEDTASEGSKVADFTTTDEDGDTVTVTVSNAGDTQYYAISGNTVVLTQAGADLVNSGADLPTFTVSATDGKQTTPATDSATPEATTDVNDAATIEIDDSSVVTFTEDTASEGSKVADFTTTDEDGDTVTVTVSNAGDTQYYAISGNTVVLTQAGADLVNSGADLPTFTVSATDGKQTTPATDSATPEATTDVNDAATIEIDDSSVVTFTEDTASEGSKVADFTTTDEDGDTVTVTVSNAGDTQYYAISGNTVVLTQAGADLVNSGADLPTFTVSATDGKQTTPATDSATPEATTDVNDAATIEIDDSSVVTFTEDTASEGSKVADFTTTDEDGDTVTVTVSNAGDTQYYAISGNTVVLTQAGADLVNSGADLPTFTVSATDGKQTTPATDSATPEATTDVNDAATIEIDDSSVVTFTEDTASEGSKVADFTTTDEDGDTVTVTVSNAGDTQYYAISGNTVVLTQAGADLVNSGADLPTFTVSATDGKQTTPATDSATPEATTDVNDAATIEIDDSSVVTFTEDTASEGSKVADFTTTDEDGDTVTVTVSNAGDTQYYAISGNTVVLTQAGADLVNSGADLPTFTVSATDGKQTTPATDSATPEATTDVNDAATIEIDDSSVVTFTEDTASEGSKVADFTTTDEDGDTVTVTVSNAGDTQYYAISGNTVVLTQAGADLVNSGADLPTFTVSATDGKQTTPATDSATPEATTDVNDAATIEIDDSSVVTFTEDTASEGSKVADFTTTDEDGDTVTVTVSNAGDTQYYAISGNTVVLTQAGADLVNSGADLPTFTVSATDGKQTTPATDSATPEATIGKLIITDIVDEYSDYSVVILKGTGGESGNIIKIYDEDNNVIGTTTVQSDGTWNMDISNLPGTPVNDNEFFKATETDSAGNKTQETEVTHYWHGDWSDSNTESSDDFIMTGAGDDIIHTDDLLTGRNENGTVTSDNDDTNDKVVIDGGAGTDTVTFGKAISEYTITTDGNGNTIVTETAASDDNDDGKGDVTELRNIETIKFNDGTYNVITKNFIPVANDDGLKEGVNVDSSVVELTTRQETGQINTTAGNTLAYNDHVIGGSGNQDILTGKGDDIIEGGSGNDTIYASRGEDTAVYKGKYSEYTVSTDDEWTYINDSVTGRDGNDKVYETENIQFSDGLYNVATGEFQAGVYVKGITYSDEATIVTDEDSAITVDVLANDTDGDGHDTLVISAIQGQDVSSGQTVDITVNGVVVGNAKVVDGKIVFTPGENLQSMNDGENKNISFEYTVSDGKVTDSAMVNINVTGSVELEITVNAPDLTNDATPTITGTTNAADGTKIALVVTDAKGNTHNLEATVNNGTYSVDVTTALPDGAYSVTATVTYSAGNSATATDNGGLIDTVTTVGADLDSGSDTGISDSDNLTKDNTPTIVGTGEVGATIVIKNSEGVTVGTGEVGEDGTYSITTTTLADGEQTLTITATDEAGNTASVEQSITVDTSAPTVDINDIVTNDATPELTGTVDDHDASVVVTINGTDYTATNNGDGTWTLADDVVSTLNKGTTTVSVTATDSAGNIGTGAGSVTLNSVPTSEGEVKTIDFEGILPEDSDTTVVTPQATNVVVILDISRSMTNSDGQITLSDNTQTTRLQLAIDSLKEMIATYESNGGVNVRLTTFNTTASATGWMNAKDALTALEGLQSGNFTNYEDALFETYNNYPETLNGEKAVVYFISDGAPNKENCDTDGSGSNRTENIDGKAVDDGYITHWKSFLTDNASELNVIGIGTGLDANDPDFKRVAVDIGTIKTNVLIVEDVTELEAILVDNASAKVEGNVLDNVSGGDGAITIASITIEGVEYTKDSFPNDGVRVASGSKLMFDFTTGDYTFIAKAGNYTVDAVESFTITAKDVDGDTTSFDVKINVNVDDKASTPILTMDIGDAQIVPASLSAELDRSKLPASPTLSVNGGVDLDNSYYNHSDNDITLNYNNINGRALYIHTEDGDDTVNIQASASHKTIELGEGNDTLAVGGSIDGSTINLGDGNNNLLVVGNTNGASIHTEEGDDTLIVGGHVDGASIHTEEGDDSITVFGNANGASIHMDDGNDSLTVVGQAVGTTIHMGEGDDTVAIGKNADGATIHMQDGDDILTIGNDANGATLHTEDGDDILSIGGNADGATIWMEDGDDILTIGGDSNSTTAKVATILMGDGNDILSIGGNASRATIHMDEHYLCNDDDNDNDDKLIIGGNADDATIYMGGGDDNIYLDSTKDITGSYLNGGDGRNDTLHFSGDASEYVIYDSLLCHTPDHIVTNFSDSSCKTYYIYKVDGNGTPQGSPMKVQNVEYIVFNSSMVNVPTYQYAITLSALLTDTDRSETLSDITLSHIPVGATLQDSTGSVISANADGSYTVSVNNDGNANVTLVSQTEVAASDLDDITASVTATEDASHDAITVNVTTEAITIEGDANANSINGTDANEHIDGKAGADIIHAGAGDDKIVFDENDVSIDGGEGEDTLLLQGDTIDFTNINTTITNIEAIDLSNNAYDYITLDAQSIEDMTDDDNILRIFGDDNGSNTDHVILEGGLSENGGDWIQGANETTADGEEFYTYTNSSSNITVKIDTDITLDI